jgi:hypothetical protein
MHHPKVWRAEVLLVVIGGFEGGLSYDFAEVSQGKLA